MSRIVYLQNGQCDSRGCSLRGRVVHPVRHRTHVGYEIVLTGLGVAIPFSVEKWIEKVGTEWVYGTAGFIAIESWALIQQLLWKGYELRNLSLMKNMMSSEESQTLFEHWILRISNYLM